jgi:fermentation-respiration switch protein FrsA (DUF1100 family)
MYFPSQDVPPPAALGVANVEEVAFVSEDGVRLLGWFLPGDGSTPRGTVLVFNGNAGNRAYRVPLAQALRRLRLNVLLFDYRGYGGSAGTPTEMGLLADARAARQYLASRADVDASHLVYLGESLGAAVAIALAAEQPPAVLILRSPFASMAEVGQHHYGWLPIRWLIRDRFAALDWISRVRAPVLVVAGDRDAIVPLAQSRRLYDAAPDPKVFVVVPGADHNDLALLAGAPFVDAIRRFLEVHLREPRTR